jgi:flagellar basal-body rod protein FlgB
MEWLALRQSVTAANIANADTPGYRARDLAAFDEVMDKSGLALTQTSPLHFESDASIGTSNRLVRHEAWDRSLSGNDVALEAELMKAGETSRMMALDSGLTRIFHRMILTSLKV